MRTSGLAMLTVMVALGASVSTQQRVIERMEPFDFESCCLQQRGWFVPE